MPEAAPPDGLCRGKCSRLSGFGRYNDCRRNNSRSAAVDSPTACSDRLFWVNGYGIRHATLPVAAAWRVTRIGHRAVIVAAGLVRASGQVLLARVATCYPAWALWPPMQIIAGLAIGLLPRGPSGAAVAGLGPTSVAALRMAFMA